MPNRQVFTKNMKRSQIWLANKTESTPTPSTLYTNTDGNISNWWETYDPSTNHAISQVSGAQRLTASSNTNSIGCYQNASRTWSTYYYETTIVDSYFLGDPLYFLIGVRIGATGSLMTGYWFQHPPGNALWQPVTGGINWGTTILNTACVVQKTSTIKIDVSGTGEATQVDISVDGVLKYSVTDPATVIEKGTHGVGIRTNSTLQYWAVDNTTVFGY